MTGVVIGTVINENLSPEEKKAIQDTFEDWFFDYEGESSSRGSELAAMSEAQRAGLRRLSKLRAKLNELKTGPKCAKTEEMKRLIEEEIRRARAQAGF